MMLKSIIVKTLKSFEDILECPLMWNVSFMFLLGTFLYFIEKIGTSHWMRSKIYFVIFAFLCQESKQCSVFTSVSYGSTGMSGLHGLDYVILM
jgi:hypothetical protein